MMAYEENVELTNLEKLLDQSGLNEDYLVNIFKYLDGPDLLKVCNLDNGSDDDKSVTELINNRVIMSSKLYDFGLLSANRIFRLLDRSLRRFKVNQFVHT